MKKIGLAINSELLKAKHSAIIWISFLAFALGPVMTGILLFLSASQGTIEEAGMLGQKAEIMSIMADWNSYLGILTQVVGVGGILVFGFVVSWLFGREYSDKTAKDLLALPIGRSRILNAKFTVYFLWCCAMLLSNLVIGFLIGSLIGLEDFSFSIFFANLKSYLVVSIMVIALGAPISFLALWGKGYLAPIGFVILSLVLSQILSAVGLGHYFPWAIPGLFSGIGGELDTHINTWSFLLLSLVGAMGFISTHLWWNRADQH